MNYSTPQEIVSALRGKKPWGIRVGHGSFLTMEFGKPEADQSPPPPTAHGEWHLWLYLCNWRIESQEAVLSGSQDERPQMQRSIETAVFDEVRTIAVSGLSHDLVIEFKSGTRMLTFSSSSSHEQEQWMLFAPDGNCLGVYGDGTWEYTARNQPRPRSSPRPSAQ